MDEKFVRDRITQLRLRKGVSEYQMSYDLGHSRGYVHNISSGKATPPMKEFFAICEYFELTPQQFFDDGTQTPELLQGLNQHYSIYGRLRQFQICNSRKTARLISTLHMESEPRGFYFVFIL